MRTLWAYAYRVAPVPAAGALNELRDVLATENAAAFEQARPWAAQLIVQQRSTDIIVITDNPAQNRAVNARLESTLERHGGTYRRTAPMPLSGGGALADLRAN